MSGVSEREATDRALLIFRTLIEMAEAGRRDAIDLLGRLNKVLEEARGNSHAQS